MTRPARIPQPMTPEQYLAFEERSPVKHEYVDGFVYAMSGTKRRHGKITFNVARRLHAVVGDGPCEVYMNDLKVQADETKYYYPDVAVTCGPEDDEAVVIHDPCLVVEADRPEVHRHWRDAGGAWRYELVTPESGGHVPVPCPDTVLTFDAIYAGVTLRPRVRRVKEGAAP